jgi:class 3 adenylate cyclase
MSALSLSMVWAALGWAAVFTVFVYGVRARWLGRYERGFLIALVAALIGIGLMSASVVGVWGYQAAKRILDQELIVELQDVGRIVETQINTDIADVEAQLKGLGVSLADARDRGAPLSDLRERLLAAQSFDSRYLQMRLVDPAGAVLAETTSGNELEPVNRIAVAFNQEGKPFVSDAYFSSIFKREILHVSLPILDKGGRPRVMVSARFDLSAEFGGLIRDSKFNQSGYAVIVDGDGQIVAHRDETRLEADVSSYPAVQLARQSNGVGEVVAPNSAGISRLFVYRAMKNPATLSKQPWVLLTEIDQSEELAPLRSLRRQLALGILLVIIGSVIVAHQVSQSIARPLASLGAFARRIGGGDLTGKADVTGKDVIGRLGATLNDMAAGLLERDHVKEVFGRYIATQVSDKILKGQVNLGGEARRVTILFSDIRNFTGMSEQMQPQQVVAFLNDYFSEMVDAVFEQGGILDKFMGDGLMAVFGSVGDETGHERRAVMAALRMKALLAKINGTRSMAGMPPIAIGIGIHTDEVIVGNIGSRKRLEYTVVGDGVNTTSRLQTLNKDFKTTILISETTYEAVKDDVECRLMPEAQLRGKTKELRFYELVSLKSAPAPSSPPVPA